MNENNEVFRDLNSQRIILVSKRNWTRLCGKECKTRFIGWVGKS